MAVLMQILLANVARHKEANEVKCYDSIQECSNRVRPIRVEMGIVNSQTFRI